MVFGVKKKRKMDKNVNVNLNDNVNENEYEGDNVNGKALGRCTQKFRVSESRRKNLFYVCRAQGTSTLKVKLFKNQFKISDFLD